MAENVPIPLQIEMEIRDALSVASICEGENCSNPAEWIASHPGCSSLLCDGCAQNTIRQKHLVTLLLNMRPDDVDGVFTCKKCHAEFSPNVTTITRI